MSFNFRNKVWYLTYEDELMNIMYINLHDNQKAKQFTDLLTCLPCPYPLSVFLSISSTYSCREPVMLYQSMHSLCHESAEMSGNITMSMFNHSTTFTTAALTSNITRPLQRILTMKYTYIIKTFCFGHLVIQSGFKDCYSNFEAKK